MTQIAIAEPSNAESLAQWRRFLSYFPFFLAWLYIEAVGFDQGWARFTFAHVLPVWAIAFVITFRREVIFSAFIVCTCLEAAWNAAAKRFCEYVPAQPL